MADDYIYRVPARGMTTYSRHDGEPIGGEFSFITQLEWLEDDSAPTRLHRRRWLLIDDELGMFYPPGTDTICERCGGQGSVIEPGSPNEYECSECGGTGDGLGREGFVTEACDRG